MKEIIIPLFNLTLNINSVAFYVFSIPVYWYAIFIVASIMIAMYAYYKNDKKFDIRYDYIVDLSLILIPISFIGARIYYILFNLDYYNTFEKMVNIKDGGLAIYGAIILGAITTYIYCKIRKISFLDLADYIIPYLALGQSVGRWGNFINAEAYGTITNLPWKMGINTNYGIEYVHPTFLYESIIDFIIFLLLIKLSKNRKYRGQIICWYLILYSFNRFWIEGLRIDSLMFGSIRISQIVSLIIVIIAIILLLKLKNKQK